jgi:hypothetical protein
MLTFPLKSGSYTENHKRPANLYKLRKLSNIFWPNSISNEDLRRRAQASSGSAYQTAEMEVDRAQIEEKFLCHRKGRLDLEPTRTTYKRKSEKELEEKDSKRG